MKTKILGLLAVLTMLPAAGWAAVVTFSGLEDAGPVNTYAEAGFVVSTGPSWDANLLTGNPVPSIFQPFENPRLGESSRASQFTIFVSRVDFGLFAFNSVDFQANHDLGEAAMRFLIEGQLNGANQFGSGISGNLTGVPFGSPEWTTAFGDGSTLINSLIITVFNVAQSGYNGTLSLDGLSLDNISLSTESTVPEPGSLALLGLGLAGLGLSRRRKI